MRKSQKVNKVIGLDLLRTINVRRTFQHKCSHFEIYLDQSDGLADAQCNHAVIMAKSKVQLEQMKRKNLFPLTSVKSQISHRISLFVMSL